MRLGGAAGCAHIVDIAPAGNKERGKWCARNPLCDRLRRAFFFSSRRRHTRSKRDWSSDVCSSDLCLLTGRGLSNCACLSNVRPAPKPPPPKPPPPRRPPPKPPPPPPPPPPPLNGRRKIGRASCRERG